jgi:Mn2+/Fe2+ NRAMP family transporter
MEILINIFLLYIKVGIVFTVGIFLWMFSFNKEKDLKVLEYFAMVLTYPFIIYSLIKIFKNDE